MIIVKKKDALQELAVSLFLMLKFNPDTTALSVMNRIRERGEAALKDAAAYTGPLTEKHIEEFLKTKPLKFTIDCGKDIIEGDTIRFMELVFNNKRRPAQIIGKRGVIAKVIDAPADDDPTLRLQVIASGGVWGLNPGDWVTRTLKIVLRGDVMRTPWDDEAERQEAKAKGALADQARQATAENFRRNGGPKTG